jgi:hypothetical protein
MKTKLIPSVIAGAVVSAVVLTGCKEASNEFKQDCKQRGGKVVREDDFEGEYLGMAPMAFGLPKPPAPVKPAAPKVPKAPKVDKLPKNDAPKPAKPKTSKPDTVNGNDLAFGDTTKPKKTKKPKKDDNDFLCVKNGEVLFEEDE